MENFSKCYNALKSKGMLPYFVSNLSHIFYLSNFTGTTAFVLIDENGYNFITDGRYEKQIKLELPSIFEKTIVSSYDNYFNFLSKNFKKIYCDVKTPLNIYLKLKNSSDVIVDIDDTIGQLRMIKSEDEIGLIKKAYHIAGKSFLASLSEFKFHNSENLWASKLEYNMKLYGFRKPSFDTIVASGVRSSLPHGVSSDKIISEDEPVIVDYGGFMGYCSDITRMIYNGSDTFVLDVIEIVNSAKLKAIDYIKPNVVAKDVDSVARSYIESKGYGKNFNHGLGHGVGIDVHEKPSLNPFDETVLKEGMVVTVEPGIYLEDNFGVRIEETVLVTENGCEILSSMLNKHFYKI